MQTKISFVDWLLKQSKRDDLIGDIAKDTKLLIQQKKIPINSNYTDLFNYIKNNVDISKFFIQHTDKYPDIKRKEIESKFGIQLNDNYANSCSPLYCLNLAFNEYKNSL